MRIASAASVASRPEPHHRAGFDVREKVAFTSEQVRHALVSMREKFPETEIALLSTCNRVELYVCRAVHGHPRPQELAEFVSQFHSIPVEHLKPHLYEKSEREAVEHLFTVAASLDSMVLGETQILGQVRGAYELASAANTTGAILHPLFQRAIAVGKQVMHETTLNEGRLSVASVAVDYARRIFDHFDDKTVLSIGAGKMTQLVLRHFAKLAPKKLLISTRDPSKAEKLAQQFGGEAAPFEFLDEQLVAADIVITSTGSTRPILTRTQFEKILKARRFRPIFLIDIAVPRDVEASVGELDAVYLYNLDDLQNVVSNTQSQRSGAVTRAQEIVKKHVDDFVAWNRSREMGPVIDQLYKRYHALAQEELARTLNKLPNLGQAEREHLEELSRRIVNKLLHDPIRTLRESDAAHSPARRRVFACGWTKLFHLPDARARFSFRFINRFLGGKVNAAPGDQGASVESSWLASRAALIAASILTIVCVGVLYVGADWPLVVVPLLANGVVLILWLISAVGIGLQILRPMKLECGNAASSGSGDLPWIGPSSACSSWASGCADADESLDRIVLIATCFFGIACTATHLKKFAKPTAWPWASLKQPRAFPLALALPDAAPKHRPDLRHDPPRHALA